MMHIGLQITHADRVMLWRPLAGGATVVGRNPEAELCIPDEALAPVQCLLWRAGPTLTLENKSAEGTRVNDELVRERLKLAAGDRLVFGPLTARVVFDEEASEEVGGRTRTLATSRPPAQRLWLTAPLTHPGRRWPLGEGGLAVGSEPTNDIVLTDPFVSSHHARLILANGRCLVRDLDSRNGVFVGEQKVVEAELPVGAQLRLGQTALLLIGAGEAPRFDDGPRLIGDSEALERVRQVVQRLAATNAPVLITGETGTGKEVVARLVNELSPRAAGPFVVLNCGSLSRTLIESELFGHEKGAFTGALGRKTGAFEAADGGTLFLDEIGELPLELQPQLLRVLENGEVRRVGTTECFHVDVRVIAATNRNLAREVAGGRFREDLFHRLHVLTIELPPLRARREDVTPLANYFAATFSPPGAPVTLDATARERLAEHDYPGNVRELRNVVQRAVLLRAGDQVTAADVSFPPSTLESRVQTESAVSHRTLQEIEKAAIIAELRRFGGNKSEAAASLGVSRSTVHRKIDEYAIDVGALT